jgi:pimeloyl-ACP methyl ester carboxylesterase
MPTALCDGIETRYELLGEGPPLLLFSPGGFDATIENWREFGIYKRLHLLEHLPQRFTCIVFDKRESGESGGRVEELTWDAYARQGRDLLDHLGIERAHLMGGCIGCSIVLQVAHAWPERADKLVLYSPAGGPRYRITQHSRLAAHAQFVEEHGVDAVVALARESAKTFAQDPRLGPWASVLREGSPGDADVYAGYVDSTRAALFGRDTVPGPPADALMELQHPALVVPGNDPSHALSAAHYLRECLPNAELWGALPEEQTADTAPARVLEFLEQ